MMKVDSECEWVLQFVAQFAVIVFGCQLAGWLEMNEYAVNTLQQAN